GVTMDMEKEVVKNKTSRGLIRTLAVVEGQRSGLWGHAHTVISLGRLAESYSLIYMAALQPDHSLPVMLAGLTKVDSQYSLLIYLHTNKKKLIVIHFYSRTSVKKGEVERMERRIVEKISNTSTTTIEDIRDKIGSVVCSESAEKVSVVLQVGTNDTPKSGSELIMGKLRQAIRACWEARLGVRVTVCDAPSRPRKCRWSFT
ncbi:unnamed protein product, partial [Darwinula stevensoni]